MAMTTVPSMYCCSKLLSFKWLIQQQNTASVNAARCRAKFGGGEMGGVLKVSRYDFWEGGGGGGGAGQQV